MVNRLNSSAVTPGGEMWNQNSVDTSINQYFKDNEVKNNKVEKQFFNNYYKRDIF